MVAEGPGIRQQSSALLVCVEASQLPGIPGGAGGGRRIRRNQEVGAGSVGSPATLSLAEASGQVDIVLFSMTELCLVSQGDGHNGPHRPQAFNKIAVPRAVHSTHFHVWGVACMTSREHLPHSRHAGNTGSLTIFALTQKL